MNFFLRNLLTANPPLRNKQNNFVWSSNFKSYLKKILEICTGITQLKKADKIL